MPATKYTYSIQNDFPNHKVATDRLTQEIQQSAIVIALDYISTSGDNCDIWFKDALSVGDVTILDGIVAAHSGEPLPEAGLPVSFYVPKTGGSQVVQPGQGLAPQGMAPARGLGGYLPIPTNNPYVPASEEWVGLYVDGDGNLVQRGAVLTDEGSYRNDFPGTDMVFPLTGSVTFTNGSSVVTGVGTFFLSDVFRTSYIRPVSGDDTTWRKVAQIISDTQMMIDDPYPGATVTDDAIQTDSVPVYIGATPGTLSLNGTGKLVVSSGVAKGCGVGLWRQGDYGPMWLVGWLSVSQRLSTQSAWFGFRNDVVNPTIFAEVRFEGTDDTKVKFITNFLGEEESTEVTLPGGGHTSSQLKYKVDVTPDACILFIQGTELARHELHIPGPYDAMVMGGGIVNIDPDNDSASSTDILVDCVSYKNYDLLNVHTMPV